MESTTQPREASEPIAEPAPAGLVRRALAQTIDLGLAVALAACLERAWPSAPVSDAAHPWLEFLVRTALPAWLLSAGVECLPGNASPGKRLLGLRVLAATAARPASPARVLLRGALKLVPFAVAALALRFPMPWDPREALAWPRVALLLASNLWLGLFLAAAAMTRRRQAPHDLAAATVVVRRAPGLPNRPPGR